MKQYMYDKDFLRELDYHQEKETYVRIIALDNNEYPREQIEGRATGGSVNIDGASAVRRSCSLSMVAINNDIIVTDDYWCYDNKFKLELGIRNLINDNYPDIIWFNMGIYIITNFSKSTNTNNLTISLSGKDKMCRLNGEVSGNIMVSTDFGTEEFINEIEETDPETEETTISYQTSITKLPIYKIIQNAVKTYGQERSENIIINDLDQWGYELWEYRGEQPMYLYIDPHYNSEQGAVINMTFNGDTKTSYEYADAADGSGYASLNEFEAAGGKFFSMNTLDNDYNLDATLIDFGQSQQCYIAKIDYGETAGYHRIPLIYNNDLILNAGETVTSLLDKLKSMLGDFEYFYDLEGRFVFQKKNTYIQELFSPIDGELVTPIMHISPYSYRFEDPTLFTAISNSPNINNLKNDFAIWGTRKSATGDDLPIHARYAIDKKPIKYVSPWKEYKNLCFLYYELIKTLEGETEQDKIKYAKENNIYVWDGNFQGYSPITSLTINSKEGFYKLYEFKEFDSLFKFSKLSTEEELEGWEKVLYYKNNNEYKPFYQKFNLEQIENIKLYNIDNNFKFEKIVFKSGENDKWENTVYYLNTIEEEPKFYRYAKNLIQKENIEYNNIDYDWRELIYQMAIDFYAHNQEHDFLINIENSNPWFIDGKTGYEQYYSDMQAFWRQLYNPAPTDQEREQYGEYYPSTIINEQGEEIPHPDKYWNKQIHLDPNTLNFWFDFLDTEGDLGNYSIKKVGARSKVVNESAVKSIYFRETPEILFIVAPIEAIDDIQNAYMPIWIQDNMQGLFYRSAQGASAVGKANELIYQHTANVEGISITSIPIYYLQPNTRIYVKDQGDYTLDKITYSLTYNGTMQLSGNKIMKQFY